MGTFGIDILHSEVNGIYENAIAGENMKKGNVCYLKDNKYYLASATTLTTCDTELRIALADITENNFGLFLIRGKIALSEGYTQNNLAYVSDTDGLIEEDINNLTTYLRKIGTFYTNTILEFNPDETVIKLDGSEINKITLFNTIPEAESLNNTDRFLIEQGGVWKKTPINSITKEIVGLGNVNNTSDANKPVSTATQNALNQRLFLPNYTIDESADLNDIIEQGQYIFQEGNIFLIGGLPPFVYIPSCKLIVEYYSDLTSDEWSHVRQTLWTPDATYIRLYDQDGNSWDDFRNVSPRIVDNLTSTLADRSLSAKQGKVLKDLVDTKEPANVNIQQHITSTSNPHGVTKAQVGLSNVDNTSDANKPVSSATQIALNLKLNTSLKGAVNGLAELGADGKVPSAQLPELGGGGLSVNQVLRINEIIY